MTVKELINELLECNMDSEVSIKIAYADLDDEHGSFEILETRNSSGYTGFVELFIDLGSQEYHERFEIEE